jgi:hypothetical protein
MKKILFTMILIAAFGISINAQDKPDFKQEIKVGGVVFTGWQYNLDNADFIKTLDSTSLNSGAPFGANPKANQFETSRNTFYLDRAYINIKASLTPQITARLTPDVYSATDGSGKTQYFTQMKYANFEYMPVNSDNGMSLSFSFGLIPNKWIEGIEKYYGYRGIAKTFTDFAWTTNTTLSKNSVTGKPYSVSSSTNSYFSSADLGMTTKFSFPQKYADLYVSILNGNGFRYEGADNRFKDIMVTGFIYPLAGQISKKMDAMKKAKKTRMDGIVDLTLGGFAYIGKQSNGEFGTVNGSAYSSTFGQHIASNRFGGMINFKYNFEKAGSVKVGGEYSLQSNTVPESVAGGVIDSTVNAGGLSGWLEFVPPVESLGDKLSLIFRYDMFNPNTTAGTSAVTDPSYFQNNGKQTFMLIGLMFKPANILTLGLSYQMTGYSQNYVVKYDGTTTSSINRLYFNTILDF